MTPLNMAKHRNSPHVAFWKMLKEGYDYFEVTRAEPKVDVCERRYVFGAEPSAKFSPADRCPAFRIPEEIATAVREKQQRDETQIAELVSRGTPTVPAKTGVDGGMNAAFLTAVKSRGGPGATIHTAAGTIPPHVNPPGFEPPTEAMSASTLSLASAESKPANGPRSSVQVASAVPGSSGGVGSFFSNLFGSKAEDSRATQPAEASASKSKPAASTAKTGQSAASASRTKSAPSSAETKTANAAATKPSSSKQDAEPEKNAGSAPGALNGAAPTVPSGGFDNRFGAWN
jgi:hypothetical protein